MWPAADKLWNRLGICNKDLDTPLPRWLGAYLLCGLHKKDDVDAAWLARKPKGRPMDEADVRPGLIAAVLYELWKRLHRYHLVLPNGDFKQVVQLGTVKRPVPSAKSDIARAQARELLQFNEICSRRWEKLGNESWWSANSWFELGAGQRFFGKETSELTHLLTGVNRSSCKRAVQRTQTAAGWDDDARLDQIFAMRGTDEVVSTRETVRRLRVNTAEGSAVMDATHAPDAGVCASNAS